MSTITDITAREILDSRGNPTIEVAVEAVVARGVCGVPSGASTGAYEAHELRDGGVRFDGRGVENAVDNVDTIIKPALVGVDVEDQSEIDRIMRELDGTETKERLGANAMLGVSIAAAKAAAYGHHMTLGAYVAHLYNGGTEDEMPLLYANLINGGKHAVAGLSFQELMVVPQTRDVRESTEMIFGIQQALKERIVDMYGAQAIGVGDEGGFAPPCESVRDALHLLYDAIGDANALIAIDAAATSFYDQEGKEYMVDGEILSADKLTSLYTALADEFPICALEDPFDENDVARHAQLRKVSDSFIIGDDLTVTNVARITDAAAAESVDGVIIKPNQIGTLTETIESVRTAHKHGLHCVASHRSGETNDDFIADISIGLGCSGIKIGALQRGERVAKYNRFLELYG